MLPTKNLRQEKKWNWFLPLLNHFFFSPLTIGRRFSFIPCWQFLLQLLDLFSSAFCPDADQCAKRSDLWKTAQVTITARTTEQLLVSLGWYHTVFIWISFDLIVWASVQKINIHACKQKWLTPYLVSGRQREAPFRRSGRVLVILLF